MANKPSFRKNQKPHKRRVNTYRTAPNHSDCSMPRRPQTRGTAPSLPQARNTPSAKRGLPLAAGVRKKRGMTPSRECGWAARGRERAAHSQKRSCPRGGARGSNRSRASRTQAAQHPTFGKSAKTASPQGERTTPTRPLSVREQISRCTHVNLSNQRWCTRGATRTALTRLHGVASRRKVRKNGATPKQ